MICGQNILEAEPKDKDKEPVSSANFYAFEFNQ